MSFDVINIKLPFKLIDFLRIYIYIYVMFSSLTVCKSLRNRTSVNMQTAMAKGDSEMNASSFPKESPGICKKQQMIIVSQLIEVLGNMVTFLKMRNMNKNEEEAQ